MRNMRFGHSKNGCTVVVHLPCGHVEWEVLHGFGDLPQVSNRDLSQPILDGVERGKGHLISKVLLTHYLLVFAI